jgi:hypothetical protein
MAQRVSYLICSEKRAVPGQENDVSGDILYQSDCGVPVLWLFCFGGRNVWEVGDDVESRGGAVGQRNPFETQVEVALTRLERAQDALSDNPHVWTWLSAMPILERKLSLQKKAHFVRLAAPWIGTLPTEQQERWRSSTAFVENFVNFLAANRRTEAAESIRRLADFCPFVAEGHGADKKAFEKCPQYKKEQRPMRVALLTLGEPQMRDLYERAVERDVAPALAEFEGMTPLAAPNSTLIKVPDMPSQAPQAAEAPKSGGLLGKLKGVFRKQ